KCNKKILLDLHLKKFNTERIKKTRFYHLNNNVFCSSAKQSSHSWKYSSALGLPCTEISIDKIS
ncbi:MAG: hypothetical protein VX176_01055, partial [Candidatus Neomarinimicrobiota bacterium]|nr:hypothetical protein [Candidatus Neomarinimicrobiota bacterium]